MLSSMGCRLLLELPWRNFVKNFFPFKNFRKFSPLLPYFFRSGFFMSQKRFACCELHVPETDCTNNALGSCL